MNHSNKSEGAIFDAIIELPPERREPYLQEVCAGDDALRQRVEALVRAHDLAGEFMQGAAVESRRDTLAGKLAEQPGDRIGRYKLLQQIGEGGCGVVYMAEQDEPVRRRVALKVIKLGMDTKQVIARFEAERQALAMMDHPNIAKVLDAGATDTGRPYFVMELVRGIKITDYCDDNNLSTAARLELFVQVCEAIQHAHQKGIIHRDIKPSNILVADHDGVPVPKIIDFGIAKATSNQRLTDKTLFTAFEQFIGTPAYMSPEQARLSGLDIDTRSDIYSLGVLLYELLTGRTPFEARRLLEAGLDEVRRIIREEEPVQPSTRLHALAAAERTTVAKHRQLDPPRLVHLIRGDLDWIVMKALEKDRARRYETANGLAADIQRHLHDEPIMACPPSATYRFQKMVRRNKLAVFATAAIAGTLVAGVVISGWQAIRATRAEHEQIHLRQVAETKEKKSEQTAQFLKDMLKGVAPSVAMGRDTTMLHEIVDKTAERIGTDLKDQPEVEIDLRLTLTQVYQDLQDYNKMEQSARETLRLARAQFGEENLAVADALSLRARAQMYLREINEGEPVARQAVAMQRKLRGRDSMQEAYSLANLGDILRHQSYLAEGGKDKRKLAEAESVTREALAISRSQLGNESDDVAWALLDLSMTLDAQGRSNDAKAAARECISICHKLHHEDYPAAAYAMMYLGDLLMRSDSTPEEAESLLRRALAIQIKTEGEGKVDQQHSHQLLGGLLERRGKLEEAEIHFRAAAEIVRKQLGADNPDLVDVLVSLAGLLRQKGELSEARRLAEEAVAVSERNSGRVEKYRRDAAFKTLAEVLAELGDSASLEILSKQLGPDNLELPNVLAALAGLLQKKGDLAGARKLAEKAADFCGEAIKKSGPQLIMGSSSIITLGHCQWEIADIMRQNGQFQQAERVLREARELFEKGAQEYPAEPFLRQEQAFSARLHGDMLEKLGRMDEAETEYQTAIALYTGLKAVAPNNTFYWQEEAYTIWMLAEILERVGKLDAVEAGYRQAITLHEQATARFPAETVFAERLGELKARLVKLLISRFKFSEATSMVAERGNAAELNDFAWFLATTGDPNSRDNTNAMMLAEKAVAATSRTNVSYLDTLAATYAGAGQFTKAISTQQEAVALSQSEEEKAGLAARLKLYQNHSPYRDDGGLAQLANARLQNGKFAEAEGLARECLTIRETKHPDDWRTFNARSMLGGSLLGQKKYAEAEPLLLSGYEGMKQREANIPSEGKVRLKEALQRLVQLYEATNRAGQAAEWKRKLADFAPSAAGK